MKSHYGLVDHTSEEDGEGQAEGGGGGGGDGGWGLYLDILGFLKLRMKETAPRGKKMRRHGWDSSITHDGSWE